VIKITIFLVYRPLDRERDFIYTLIGRTNWQYRYSRKGDFMSKYDTVIFDLDGTLLDTLDDLTDSVNHAMKKFRFPLRTSMEVRSFMGNGVVRLMELSVPNGRLNPHFEEALESFKEHYSKHSRDKTQPYPGIIAMLRFLSENGCRLAIVSNKYNDAVQNLKRLYFEDLISVAIGEKEAIRKKPAPDTVLQALRELKSSKDYAVYVGDTEVDIETAKNAKMDCISVSWGFRDKDWLEKSGAGLIVDTPLSLLAHL
jgi:haloacid dehalogenase superfamily, subfamily IA, variant 3 with third motif having DD or ED/haloacid dehalogenase superfamily, subfamily IA, variant 1 with third motif having Dx(3-4)D or Dx(3-4)E